MGISVSLFAATHQKEDMVAENAKDRKDKEQYRCFTVISIDTTATTWASILVYPKNMAKNQGRLEFQGIRRDSLQIVHLSRKFWCGLAAATDGQFGIL